MAITPKAARVNANLTLKDAAKAIGVSVKTLWSYESGLKQPNALHITKMLALYGCKFEDIIFVSKNIT